MAGLDPLESAFTQQPAQLADPVPDATAQPDNPFEAALASAPQGQVDLGGAQPAPPVEANPFEAALSGATPEADVDQQPPVTLMGSEFLGSNATPTGIMQQFENAEARIRASFGRSDVEKEKILKGMLGNDNVRSAPRGGFLIKPKGKDKFIKLEPDTFDVVGDIIFDGFRDLFSGTAGVAAVAAQGPAAAEPISSAIGFGAGVAAGEAIADNLVTEVFGVPRDPSRGGVVGPDAGLGEKVGASFARAGENLTTGAIATVLNSAANKIIKGVQVKRKAMQGLRTLKDTPKSEVLKESININLQTMDELGQMNKLVNLPGTDVPILAHQLAPHTEATKLAKSLTGNPNFIKAQELAAKNLDDSIVNMIEEAGDLAPKSFRNVLRTGEKTIKPGVQQDVKALFRDVRKAEGKLIETFRMKASKEAAGQPVPMNNTFGAMKEVMDDLGVQVNQGGGIKFPDDDSLAQLLGTDSKPMINGLKKDLSRIYKQMVKGQNIGFTIDDMIAQSKIIGAKNDAAGRIGGKYKFYIGKLSSSMRSDVREAMPQLLNEVDSAAYTTSINKFQQAAQGQEVLKNLLKHNDMATNTFAKGIITKGRTGLSQIKATKAFLNETDPTAWKKITSEFFEELALKHRNVDPNAPLSFNSRAMRKELSGYGPDMLKELMPGGVKPGQVFRALDLSEQLERTLINGSDNEIEQVTKSMFGAMSQFISAKFNAVYSVAKFGNSNQRLLKLMNRQGVDKFLEKVPAGDRGMWKSVINSHIAAGVKRGTIKTLQTTRDVMLKEQVVQTGRDTSQAILEQPQPQQ